ncbi:hypothetical protein HDU67_004075 [Dinochytrium kinnereticum]|nr:hypothetical protein HDU67_004075 [Dinochytrium kinnereticum]
MASIQEEPTMEVRLDEVDEDESSINTSNASVRILDVSESEYDDQDDELELLHTYENENEDEGSGEVVEDPGSMENKEDPSSAFGQAIETVESNNRKPLVVFLYSWKNIVAEEQTDPREAYDSLVQQAGDLVDVWLDVVDGLPSQVDVDPSPPTFSDLVNILRKASLVVAFISDEFCADENCVKSLQFAAQGLDLPVLCVSVGKRHTVQEGSNPTWMSSPIGSLLQDFE